MNELLQHGEETSADAELGWSSPIPVPGYFAYEEVVKEKG